MQPLLVKESDNPYRDAHFYWRESKPFVENKRAVLIHRPRVITSYKLKNRTPHHAIEYHCGNTQTGKGKFVFHDEPPLGHIVCQRCEELATHRGFPSSNEIANRHVCVGGVKAVSACCN